MERCPNCGASIRAGARFCTACGFRLEPAVAASPATVEPGPVSGAHGGTSTGEGVTLNMPTTPTAPDLEADGPGPQIDFDGEAHHLDENPPGGEGDAVASDAEAAGAVVGAGTDSGQTEYPVGGPTAGSELTDIGRPDSSSSMDLAHDPALTGTPSMGDDEVTHDAVTTADELDESVLGNDELSHPSDDSRPVNTAESDSPPASDPAMEAGGGEATHDPPETGTGTDNGEGSERSGNWWTTLGENGDDPTGQNRDDVVIGTTVVRESSWSADPAEPTRFRPVLASDAPAEQEGDPSSSSDVVSPSDASDGTGPEQLTAGPSSTEGGRDSDWEPWGAGTDVPGSAADHGQLAYFPGVAQLGAAQSADRGTDSTAEPGDPIQRARMLLGQLQATLDDLATAPVPAEITEPAPGLPEPVAEASQLLEAFGLGQPMIDDERLTELERLTSDLEGRDYDIRALQRFAQERELILDLATGYRRQQDLIGQLRQVLPPTPGDE